MARLWGQSSKKEDNDVSPDACHSVRLALAQGAMRMVGRDRIDIVPAAPRIVDEEAGFGDVSSESTRGRR